jgi:Transposase IS66 family
MRAPKWAPFSVRYCTQSAQGTFFRWQRPVRVCSVPLYRQSAILERDTGLELSRATLDGWVLRVGELLIPMVAAMRRELISGSLQADETRPAPTSQT